MQFDVSQAQSTLCIIRSSSKTHREHFPTTFANKKHWYFDNNNNTSKVDTSASNFKGQDPHALSSNLDHPVRSLHLSHCKKWFQLHPQQQDSCFFTKQLQLFCTQILTLRTRTRRNTAHSIFVRFRIQSRLFENCNYMS